MAVITSTGPVFTNQTDGTQVAKIEQANFQGGLIDVLGCNYQYLAGTGIPLQVIKALRNGTLTVANSGGTITITLTPPAAGSQVNPNPNA